MKKFFLILIASLALVMTHDFNRAYAGDHDGDDGIPLSKLAGRYADTGQGSITICFKPDFTDTENCSTSGAVPVPFNAPLVGQFTQDKDGESCGTYTGTLGAPGGPGNLPIAHDHFVGKVTNYDPDTGSGDKSYTDYIGGKCRGTKFDGTGATVNNTSMIHFVASDNGERVDLVVTNVTDSVGDIGAFNLTGFNLKQK